MPHPHQFKPSGYQCSTVEMIIFCHSLSFHLLLHLLLQIGCVDLNPGPRKSLLCSSCKKLLVKSTKKRPHFVYNLWLVTFYLQRYLKRQSVHCSKFCFSQLFTRICDLGTLLQTILTSKKLTNFILIQIEVTGTLKLLRSIQVFH